MSWRLSFTASQTAQAVRFSGRVAFRGGNGSHEVDNWFVDEAISDTLREEFGLHGAQAALALGGALRESSLLNLWLHRLYQYLCDQNSSNKRNFTQSFLDLNGTNVTVELPVIERVCQSSEAFCLSLRRRALEGEVVCESLEQHFQSWIVENSSEAEPWYWSSKCSIRGWISNAAKCAKASIPIDFLSARLNIFRLPRLPSECGSLRAFFDQVAREEGLMWGITDRGLWMAQGAPQDGAYIDSHGRQHGNAASEREEQPQPNRKFNLSTQTAGRKSKRPLEFQNLCARLWRENLGSQGNVSKDGLRRIAVELDSTTMSEPTNYLEGKAASQLKEHNRQFGNSPKKIKSWTDLVVKGDPQMKTAMRKLLSRCASVIRK